MNILFNLPDDIAKEFDAFCERRKSTRAHTLRQMICGVLRMPVPERKRKGRKSGTTLT